MATGWDVATVGCTVTAMGWLLTPIIGSLAAKILSYLGFDASQKLKELEFKIIPDLKNTLHAVDQERMMQRGTASKSNLFTLDKMAAMLRHAREDAEDIFDDAQHKVVCGDILDSSCVGITRIVRSGSDRLLQWARTSWFLPRTSGGTVTTSAEGPDNKSDLVDTSAGASDDYPASVTVDIAVSDNDPVSVTTGAEAPDNRSVLVAASGGASDEPISKTTPSDSSARWLSCLCSSFDFFKNGCRSTFHCLVCAIQIAWTHRDWFYDEVVGITSYQDNANALDFVLTAISRRKLKERIEKVESTVSEVKKSPFLEEAIKTTLNDIAGKGRNKIRISSKQVFGRREFRDYVMAMLHETTHSAAPSSSTSPCYSVIGIYGDAGSGKTTFAQYTRDYIEEECKEERLFDTIMCIHVSQASSVDDIFHEMLKDITKGRHSNISDRQELEEKLKESLSDKRFLLIIDDIWGKKKSDTQLQEVLFSLNVGQKGSKILVMARTKDAASALCANEPIEMPDLDEEQYYSMFMHHALGATSVADEEFISVGREIAKKLHQSPHQPPIVAAIVAGRLGTNPDIRFWKQIAKLDIFNDTTDALCWSYLQLNPGIRRCLEYCNIFPRRFEMEKGDLVHLWIAQGFVKSTCEREDMEEVAEGYIQELVSCSFLQPEGNKFGTDIFSIHDVLRDFLEVTGCGYYKIENSRHQRGVSWKDYAGQDVRHVFVQNCDGELIMEKILKLKNLRTLIINFVEGDITVEEKVIEGICKRLLKLRVFDFAVIGRHYPIKKPNKFSVPESTSQLKHLRYLAFRECVASRKVVYNLGS